MSNQNATLMLRLREALAASWDSTTAYQSLHQPGNPAMLGAIPRRVVQHFFPETELIEGKVWTGTGEETHFWNALRVGDSWHHIDLTWQQFLAGSVVKAFTVLDRSQEGYSKRTALLLRRVEERLGSPDSDHAGRL